MKVDGPIEASTGTGKAFGTGDLSQGVTDQIVYNSACTSNSMVLVTVQGQTASSGPSSVNTNGGIRADNVVAGHFRVWTMNGQAASATIHFNYMIVN